MTIKEFIKWCEDNNVDPDTPIVKDGGPDHSYYDVRRPRYGHAEQIGNMAEFYEYYNDDSMSPDGRKVRAVIL